jgi:hypothetical protein
MKMMKYVFFLLCFSATIVAQNQNVTLLSNLNQYPSIGYNDCWGYVDSQGREYALLGTEHGTSIIEITNPTQPVERAFIPGPGSLWRILKPTVLMLMLLQKEPDPEEDYKLLIFQIYLLQLHLLIQLKLGLQGHIIFILITVLLMPLGQTAAAVCI